MKSYDSRHNRIAKNDMPLILNTLNQIESPDNEYDRNGNLICFGNTHLLYDSLDRLITVKTPTHSHSFTYDAEHRRLTKDHTLYIWDGNHELGTLDEYRILGPTPYAEIGSAITIFIKDDPFFPIHDLHGNLIQLLTPDQDRSLEQSFTAFGEGEAKLSWGFSSKRHDPETDLIYFGRRFYDSKQGRFISPDPEGYTDSSNLYAFVLNNPLINRDPYGLFMDAFIDEAVRQKDYSWRDFAPSLKEFGSGFIHGMSSSLINNAEFVGGFGAAGVDLFGLSMPGTFDKGFVNTNNLLTTTESLQALSNQTFAYDRKGIGNSVAYGLGMFGTEAAIAYMTRGGSLFKHLPILGKASRIIPEARSTLKTMNVSRSIFQPKKTGSFLNSSSIGFLEKINEAQKSSLIRFNRKKPASAIKTVIRELPTNGLVFQADALSRNIPGSFARYEKQVDHLGRTIEYTKTTFGPDGQIIHVKDKIRNVTFNP